MSIEIPADLETFVQQELAAGRYKSEQELVSEALRMLQRDRADAIAGIREGLQDAMEGRVQPLREAFAEIRNESANGN